MQTKVQSAIEVIASTCVAFGISVAVGQLVYPLYGLHPSVGTNAELTLWFTVISIVRSYVTRRFFNWLHTAREPVDTVVTERGTMYRSVRNVVFPRHK